MPTKREMEIAVNTYSKPIKSGKVYDYVELIAQALEDYRKELAKVARDHGHDFHMQLKKLKVKDFTDKRTYKDTMAALSQTYLECDCISKAIKHYGEED